LTTVPPASPNVYQSSGARQLSPLAEDEGEAVGVALGEGEGEGVALSEALGETLGEAELLVQSA
jgi:hypothetical protein